MSTSPRDEMTEDEIAMRKFLKQLGVAIRSTKRR